MQKHKALNYIIDHGYVTGRRGVEEKKKKYTNKLCDSMGQL